MERSKMPYSKFLWNSHNEHGIHSPFIYKLLSQGLYSKEAAPRRGTYNNFVSALGKDKVNLLHRLVYHFQPAKLLVLGDEAAQATEMIRHAGESNKMRLWFFSTLAPIPGGVDMAYISHNEKDAVPELFEQLLTDVHNDTVCVIGNIHASAEMEEVWGRIIQHPKVRVTVDIYHLGLVFFRREQAEQHFMVRPYKSAFINAFLGVRNLWGLSG